MSLRVIVKVGEAASPPQCGVGRQACSPWVVVWYVGKEQNSEERNRFRNKCGPHYIKPSAKELVAVTLAGRSSKGTCIHSRKREGRYTPRLIEDKPATEV